jgi:GPH family glycoside/pentoside/hexuronide:cation symporter
MTYVEEIKPTEWDIAPTRKMASYGFGYLIITYLVGAYAGAVFYFYEVEVGLPVLLVGLSFIIFAIWNMINDPLLGYLTERPTRWTRKWGFRTPWIIISIIPTLILFVLIFLPPNINPTENPWPIFIYMLIITCLFDTFFSIFNSHVYGGFTNQFRTEFERRKGFAIVAIIAGFGVIFIGFIPPLIIQYGDKSSFFLAYLLTSIALAICAIFLIPGIRESSALKESFIKGYEASKDTTYFKTLKIALGRKNFSVSLITYTLIITTQTLSAASNIYFIKDILGLPLSVAILIALAGFVGYIISIPLWVRFSRKHGFARTYELCLFLAAITYIPSLWLTTLPEMIIFTFIGGIPYAGYTIMITPIVSDCYDDVAIYLGKRQEATLQGIRTFFLRLAIVVQGIVLTIIHIMTGYNPNPKATQTPLAIWGIRIHAALIPVILMAIASIIVYKFYDLRGEKKEHMLVKLREKGL